MKTLEITEMEAIEGGFHAANCLGGAATGFEVGAWFGPWGAVAGAIVGCIAMQYS